MKTTESRSVMQSTQGAQLVAAILLAFNLPTGSAVAQTIWNIPGVGDWNTAGNWSLGVPNSASGTTFDAQIRNGGTAQLSAPGASVRRMRAGVFAGGGHFDVNGGALTITEDLILNFEGTGPASTTVKAGGTITARDAIVGYSSTGFSNFTITGASSSVNVGTTFVVGLSGGGALAVADGGALSSVTGIIARNAGSVAAASVDGPGSAWTNADGLIVGWAGNGSLTVQGEGAVSNTFATIGVSANSTGTVQVLGPGSTWTNSLQLLIGQAGAGTLNILSGGTVSNTYAEIGTSAGSTGAATVDGAGSTWSMSSDLEVGIDGNGALTIANGGRVDINGLATLGDRPGSYGAALVDGANSNLEVAAALIIGGFEGSGVGSLAIRNGGHVTSDLGYIGYSAGSTGTVTVDGPGSTWANSNRLFVGTEGYGALYITGGGQVTSVDDATIGYGNDEDSGVVEVTGAGSKWTVSDADPAGIYVGSSGSGLLSVNDGGVVAANVPNGIQVGYKGTIRGNSTIEGRVFNYGLVSPGSSLATTPGTLTMTGQYWQGAEGKLQIELASASSYDKLDFLGGLLDGALNVTLLGGYTPSVGTSFDILDKAQFGVLNGVFATVNLPALGGTLGWDTSQLYTTGVLSVTSSAPHNVAFFDVIQPNAAGPPYPAQAIVADVRTRFIPTEPTIPGEPMTPVQRLKLSLFNVAIPGEPSTPIPMALAATDGQDGTALNVAFRLIPGNPILPAGSSFDLFFELEAHPDSAAAPELIPGEPIIPTEPMNSFDVTYDAIVDGLGVFQQTAHFAINAGQPLLFDNLVIGPPQSPAFHVTFDLVQTGGAVMTAEDLFTVTVSGVVIAAGDFNSNGVVDGDDLAAWKTGFGTTGAANRTQGNADGDHDVDGGDFLVWQRQLGSGISVAAAAVPEPASTRLLLVGACLFWAAKRAIGAVSISHLGRRPWKLRARPHVLIAPPRTGRIS